MENFKTFNQNQLNTDQAHVQQADISSSEPLNHHKVYVDVEVLFDKYGHMIPSAITWEDGTTYKIDKLIDTRAAFSAKAGGHGDLYLVRIRQSDCHLFFERNPYRSSATLGRWFVSKIT